LIGDWNNPYITMDFEYEANIIRSLNKILANGNMQKGYKPVHWCLDCASALAEAEVEYKDKTSPSIDVRYGVIDEKVFLSKFSDVEAGVGTLSVVIWTTTPWTIPQNRAVAYNRDVDYAVYEVSEQVDKAGFQKGDKFVVAKKLVNSVLACANLDATTCRFVSDVDPGFVLELAHPFRGIQDGQGEWDYPVPMLPGEHVTDDAGGLAVGLVVRIARLVHRVANAPMYRLQPVTDVGQRTADNDRHGVVYKRLFHLCTNVYRNNILVFCLLIFLVFFRHMYCV